MAATGIITTGSFMRDHIKGLGQFVGKSYNDFPVMYDKVFKVVKTNRPWVEDTMISTTGLAQLVQEGGKVPYDTMGQRWTVRYTPHKYGIGITTTREALDDSQQGIVLQARSEALARSMKQKKEQVHADVLNNAFTASYAGGDGKELIANDHPVDTGTTSNYLATPADLSETSLEQMEIELAEMVDQRGMKVHARATKLIVPKELKATAHRILRSDLRPSTPDNDANYLKDSAMIKDVLVWHYLSDTDAFFLLTDVPAGLTSYDRMAMEMSAENDFDTDNVKLKVLERYCAGWTDFRGIFGTEGAA